MSDSAPIPPGSIDTPTRARETREERQARNRAEWAAKRQARMDAQDRERAAAKAAKERVEAERVAMEEAAREARLKAEEDARAAKARASNRKPTPPTPSLDSKSDAMEALFRATYQRLWEIANVELDDRSVTVRDRIDAFNAVRMAVGMGKVPEPPKQYVLPMESLLTGGVKEEVPEAGDKGGDG